MKARINLIIIFIAVLACTGNDLSVMPAEGVLNKPSFGKDNQSVIFRISAEENLNIHIVRIEESRCPADVQCISAGYVTVVFKVDDVGEVELITPKLPGSPAKESFEFSAGGHDYRLTLNDVAPYPTTKNYEESKSVEFVIESI